MNIVPALLWRRTRLFAFTAAVALHLMNWQLFNIGIFPWMMIAATTVFLEPDWPRRLAALVTARRSQASGEAREPARRLGRLGLAALATYVLLQCLVPLRHYLYRGNVPWTEQGHRFSWRMKLRSKRGTVEFVVVTPSESTRGDPSAYLARWQVSEMVGRPDMVLQFAHLLAAERRRAGDSTVAVHAETRVSLNHRPAALFIDPTVDLANQPRTLRSATWITPMPATPPGSARPQTGRPETAARPPTPG